MANTMSDPFDKLRNIIKTQKQRDNDELIKALADKRVRQQEYERLERQRSTNFHSSVNSCNLMVRQVLDEFSNVIWCSSFLGKKYRLREFSDLESLEQWWAVHPKKYDNRIEYKASHERVVKYEYNCTYVVKADFDDLKNITGFRTGYMTIEQGWSGDYGIEVHYFRSIDGGANADQLKNSLIEVYQSIVSRKLIGGTMETPRHVLQAFRGVPILNRIDYVFS